MNIKGFWKNMGLNLTRNICFKSSTASPSWGRFIFHSYPAFHTGLRMTITRRPRSASLPWRGVELKYSPNLEVKS
jgi:hypothetical protein